MKITLISPLPNPRDEHSQRAKTLFPPLSLMTIAALTPPNVEVELIDESVTPLPDEIQADLVGITATTATANRAYEIADHCRSKGLPVALGGIHVTALPSEASLHADAVVVGEAEGKWQRLLSDLQCGRLQKLYADDQRPHPDQIPAARRDVINESDYFFANTLQTTRGCPYDCSFCSVSPFFGRTYRTRPAHAVVKEIERIPGNMLLFVDDNIIGNPSYARTLFTEIRPLGKKWLGQASMTMLKNPDVMKLAAQSGCSGLFVGMETLSEASLANVGKTINHSEDYETAVNMLHDLGISILGAFVYGFDEDDESVFERTVEFVNRAKLDAAQFAILTPYPGTRVFNELSSQGRIFDTDWTNYDAEHVVFKPAKMKPEKLLEGLVTSYQQIYCNSSIVKRLGFPFGKGRPVGWAINVAYRKRIRAWAQWMESQKKDLKASLREKQEAHSTHDTHPTRQTDKNRAVERGV